VGGLRHRWVTFWMRSCTVDAFDEAPNLTNNPPKAMGRQVSEAAH
jgi:hypothetical protein